MTKTGTLINIIEITFVITPTDFFHLYESAPSIAPKNRPFIHIIKHNLKVTERPIAKASQYFVIISEIDTVISYFDKVEQHVNRSLETAHT